MSDFDNSLNLEAPGKYRMSSDAKRELEKWVDSVIYDVKFRPDTPANLKRLKEIVDDSMFHFVTIAANSEALVYKIGRWMVVNAGVKSDDLIVLHGNILESYISGDSAEWKKLDRLDEFFSFFGEQYRGRWIIIPETTVDMSVGMSVYLMSQFRKFGAVGLIVYAYGGDNLVENLIRNVEDRYCYEFPKSTYRRSRRKLPEDEY